LTNEQSRAKGSEKPPDKIPNGNIPISQNTIAHPGVFLLAFASGLFSAMHAITWHFEFPSTTEKVLWQTATVIAAVSPVLGLVTIPLAQLHISGGDSQLFAWNCLHLMRQYSWHVSEKGPVHNAYKRLENTLAMPETAGPVDRQRRYDNIFDEDDHEEALDLMRELNKFLMEEDNFPHLRAVPQDLEDHEKFKK
jgi:hypothetical protein